jgi:hypothetical protein
MKAEEFIEMIIDIEEAFKDSNKIFLMKGVIADKKLNLYSNNSRVGQNSTIFGQIQNFYFYVGNDLSINQIDANNDKEINTYLSWKFNKDTKNAYTENIAELIPINV